LDRPPSTFPWQRWQALIAVSMVAFVWSPWSIGAMCTVVAFTVQPGSRN
jgi:hypothetical protein